MHEKKEVVTYVELANNQTNQITCAEIAGRRTFRMGIDL
jgi:hypothetical protein